MDKKIKDIIKKVRAIYKYDDRFKSLVSMHPTVKSEENANGDLVLKNIDWQWYDSLYISSTGITYSPEHGNSKELITYNNWNELLEL